MSTFDIVRSTVLVAAGTTALAAARPAAADPGPPRPAATSPWHADAEIDPTAYALSGNSLHVGLGYRRFRLDLGNFAMAMPSPLVTDGFDVRFDGFGAKLQAFPLAEQRGLFVGIDAAVVRAHVHRQGSDLTARQTLVGAGVHVGYRFQVVDRLYVSPWIGVDYQLGADDVTLGGATYQGRAVTVFPAVHVGYRFR